MHRSNVNRRSSSKRFNRRSNKTARLNVMRHFRGGIRL